MPSGSTVALHYDGTDITQYVLPSSARFEAQLNAIPGIFEFTVKDLNHTMSFVTGRKVTLEVDGVLLYGGYVLQVNRAYPFEAMDTTTTPPSDTARYWKIRGVDFNRLFDTRVLRNPASYTTRLPTFSSSVMDGALVRAMWSDWIDTPSGFDTTTYVDDIAPPFDLTGPGLWKEQGTKARDQMKDFAQFNGALWYFDAAQNLHWHAIENTVQRWGFSDQPNKLGITASPLSFQGSTIGPRSIDGTESGDHMINDALAWGGSPFGSTGGVIFSRAQNSTSISAHERWQSGETHFGELGFGIQSGLDKLVDVIVNGSPATVIAGQERGLSLPQWSFKFTWFAHLVPKLSGVPDHIRPGYLATIELKTFGPSGSPLVQLLPLRQVVITFPGLDPDGNGYVQFEGEFGLQLDDPFTLWRFLLDRKPKPATVVTISTTSNDSTTTQYGSLGEFTPTPAPDGSTTVFSIPFGYIANTTEVYLFVPGAPGGVLLRRGIDYTESDPASGQITVPGPLPSGYQLDVFARTSGATADGGSTGTVGGGSSGSGTGSTGGTYSSSGVIDVTTDGTVIDGLEIIRSTGESGALINILGTSGSPIDGVIIRNCHLVGRDYGILARHATNLTIENCTIEDVQYAGIAGYSVVGATVINNTVRRIAMTRTDFSVAGQLNNAYGITFDRFHSGNLTTDPQSANIEIGNNFVADSPLWMGINLHAGLHVNIHDNHVEGCPRGIFVAGDGDTISPNESGYITIHANQVIRCVHKSGGTTDTVALFIASLQGGSSDNVITDNEVGLSFGGGDQVFRDYGGASVYTYSGTTRISD